MSGDVHADDPETGEAIQRTLDDYHTPDTDDVHDTDRLDRLERDVELLADLTSDLTGTLSDVVELVGDERVTPAEESDDERIRGYQ